MIQTELPTSISPRFISHILSKIAELEAIEENRLGDIKQKKGYSRSSCTCQNT